MTLSVNGPQGDFPIKGKSISFGEPQNPSGNTIKFPKYELPKPKLTKQQQQYVDAQKTMEAIEVKYQPNRARHLAIHHTTPFDVSQLSAADKKEYMAAKGLVDKVSNAQKRIEELEVKYQPNRARHLAIHHTTPFDVNKLTPKEKKEYLDAQKIIDTYIPKNDGKLEKFAVKG